MAKDYTDGDFDWLPIITVILLLLAIGAGVWYFTQREEEREEQHVVRSGEEEAELEPEKENQATRGEFAPGTAPPPIDLNSDQFGEVAERFVQAHGGRVYLENLTSLGIRGSLVTEGVASDFFMVKRPPDDVYVRIENETSTPSFIIAGPEGVWQVQEITGGRTVAVELKGTDAEAVRTLAEMLSPFAELAIYENGQFQSMHLAISDRDVRRLVRVEFRFEEEDAYALLDPETYWVVEHGIERPGRNRRVIMEDYRRVGQTWLPFDVTIMNGNEVVYRLKVESLTLNAGVLSDLFLKPDAEVLNRRPPEAAPASQEQPG